jgi:hypothetical protein
MPEEAYSIIYVNCKTRNVMFQTTGKHMKSLTVLKLADTFPSKFRIRSTSVVTTKLYHVLHTAGFIKLTYRPVPNFR